MIIQIGYRKLKALDVSYLDDSTASETEIQFDLLNSTFLSDESIKNFTGCEKAKCTKLPLQTGIPGERYEYIQMCTSIII